MADRSATIVTARKAGLGGVDIRAGGTSTGGSAPNHRASTASTGRVAPVTTVLASLLAQPVWVVYAVVFVVVLLEGAVPAGLLVPGEATALAGGATVALGVTDLVPMALAVVAGAVLGDGLGFLLGRTAGPRVLRWRVLASRRDRVLRVQTRIAERGGAALVAARWTAFVRTMAPALAGASGMPYRRFAGWNALGALTWGVTSVAVGAVAGRSAADVQGWVGAAGVFLAVVVVLAVLRAAHRRRPAPGVPSRGEVVLAA